jgi:hypothetical protein
LAASANTDTRELLPLRSSTLPPGQCSANLLFGKSDSNHSLYRAEIVLFTSQPVCLHKGFNGMDK